MDRNVTISLGGQDYEIHRARLGKYLLLQEALAAIKAAGEAAAKGGGGKAVIEGLTAYFGVYIPDLTRQQVASYSWVEIFSALIDVSILNRLDFEFAVLKPLGGKKGDLPEPWEYPQRMRYHWIHLLANRYHWTREEIENIWPDDAYAYLQEIIASDQYEKEFAHSLSDVAYSYDQATKKSKYQPLARPPWMILRDPKQVITRLPRMLMPIGLVEYPEGEEHIRPGDVELIDIEEMLS